MVALLFLELFLGKFLAKASGKSKRGYDILWGLVYWCAIFNYFYSKWSKLPRWVMFDSSEFRPLKNLLINFSDER